jgi:hypothetical protein
MYIVIKVHRDGLREPTVKALWSSLFRGEAQEKAAQIQYEKLLDFIDETNSEKLKEIRHQTNDHIIDGLLSKSHITLDSRDYENLRDINLNLDDSPNHPGIYIQVLEI